MCIYIYIHDLVNLGIMYDTYRHTAYTYRDMWSRVNFKLYMFFQLNGIKIASLCLERGTGRGKRKVRLDSQFVARENSSGLHLSLFVNYFV